MIYLLATSGGVVLLIIGLYLMTFGFGVPPSFSLFFLGLCLFVTGMLMIILFAGKIDLQSLKIETTPIPRRRPTKRRKPTRRSRPGIMEKLKTEKVGKEETPIEEPVKSPELKKEKKTAKPTRRPPVGIMEKLKTEKLAGEEPPRASKTKKKKGAISFKERLQSIKREHMKDVEGVDENYRRAHGPPQENYRQDRI